jgi:hypothetical protein
MTRSQICHRIPQTVDIPTPLYVIVIRAIVTDETRNFRMPSSVLSVRLSDQERALLEAASSQARTNVSDFVRRKALEAAELDVLERRIVTIPAKGLGAPRGLGGEGGARDREPQGACPQAADMAEVAPPRPLAEDDERNHFDCGRDSLNAWFRRHAWHNHVSG